jgi:hypothetical protein
MVSVLSLPLLGLNVWQPNVFCAASLIFYKEFYFTFLGSSFFVLIVVALINLIICGIVIRKRKIQPSGEDALQQKKEFKLTKMMLIVVGVFYFCWLPYTAISAVLVTSAAKIFPQGLPISVRIFAEFTKVPVLVNGACNPLVYAMKSSAYRRAFRKTLGWQVPHTDLPR